MATVRAGPCAPGLALSCRPVTVRGVVQKRVPVARAQDENPFVKFGSQLVQAGSQFTQTFTGTARIARKNTVKDDVVFVAGASGRVGSRIVKECAKAGYQVRCGVRSKEKGQDLIESIRDAEELTPQQLRKIRIEEFDLFEPDTIPAAIGNAACVICSIGAPEDKPFDQTGPRRIDGDAAIKLVQVAAKQNVKRFMMVSSLGTTKFGLPASLLNLFWGVLYWKQQAENELIRSGMLYTIIRPGGMERPTDSYKLTHNTVMYPRDKMFGGQISRLQVAEVVAACVATGDKSANKTIELVASDVAPPRTLEEMLGEQPVEITVEELREKQAEIADVRNRAEGFSREAEELEAKLAEAEERKVRAEQEFSTARKSLEEVKEETSDVLSSSSQARRTIEQLTSQKEKAELQETAVKAVLDAQRAAQREFKVLTAKEIREVQDAVLNPPVADASNNGTPAAAAKANKPSGNPFAGLFGGSANKEEEKEEAAEEEAPAPQAKAKAAPAKKAPAKAAPAKAAPAKAEPAEEKDEETVQVSVKGGGLFGMFQQDTVYADDVVPPATELVERAVTKRGTGRKSVKELIGKSPKDEASDSPPPPTPKPAAKKSTPSPPKAATPAKPTDKELSAKREKAVAAALNNLGVAAKKVEEKVEEEVKKDVKKVEEKVEKAATAASSNGSKKEEPAAAAPAATGKSFAGDKDGAKAWIKNWRSKQPSPAFSFKLW